MTRRRTELIALINNKGKQPINIDKQIWLKLEKLASSRQRENRTAHGRYANSYRRIVRRTGAIGEEGVRERLAESYRRSPNLDEVAQEMAHHKGYRKEKLDPRIVSKR